MKAWRSAAEKESATNSLVALALIVPAVLLEGFTFATLWRWFAVPAFGLPPLSIPHALGLAMILRLATVRHSLAREKKSGLELMLNGAGGCLFALLYGWILTWFA